MSKQKVRLYKISNLPKQTDRIEQALKLLGLPGVKAKYLHLLDYFVSKDKTYLDFLEAILNEELIWKEDERIRRWRNQAKFFRLRTLDDFDFSFQPKANRKLIQELKSCRFIDEGKNVILFGPPGVGKTHLALALGDIAINNGYEVKFLTFEKLIELIEKSQEAEYQRRLRASLMLPRLLIMDEIDDKIVLEETGNRIAKIIYDRYENNDKVSNQDKKTSIIFTSNVSFSIWAKSFGTKAMAQKTLDRIVHHKYIIDIEEGGSYRAEEDKLAKLQKLI